MSQSGAAAPPENVYEVQLRSLSGEPVDLSQFAGKVVLAVNVASRCGFTPQYSGLQALQERFEEQGFTVLGFPCNQFLFQEPGSADQIQSFCSATYGVTFPLFEKLKVKGSNQHPLYQLLTQQPDDQGSAGEVKWNFEKFLVDREGKVRRRFRTRVEPADPGLVQAIEELL